MAHRSNDPARLHGASTAGGSGRAADSRLVEQNEQALSIHAGEVEIAGIGKAKTRVTVDLHSINPIQNRPLKGIPEL